MSAADRYEQRFPGTGLSEAQRQERGERLEHRDGRRARGIVVPGLPWLDDRPVPPAGRLTGTRGMGEVVDVGGGS